MYVYLLAVLQPLPLLPLPCAPRFPRWLQPWPQQSAPSAACCPTSWTQTDATQKKSRNGTKKKYEWRTNSFHFFWSIYCYWPSSDNHSLDNSLVSSGNICKHQFTTSTQKGMVELTFFGLEIRCMYSIAGLRMCSFFEINTFIGGRLLFSIFKPIGSSCLVQMKWPLTNPQRVH